MTRGKRHTAPNGALLEETNTYRIPFRGEYFLSPDWGVCRCSSPDSVVNHSVRGRVRHILREVKTTPERSWHALTLTLVPEHRLTKAEAERDAALERVAELEGINPRTTPLDEALRLIVGVYGGWVRGHGCAYGEHAGKVFVVGEAGTEGF